MPDLASPAMPFIHGPRLPSIEKRDIPARIKEELERLQEPGLIGFDDDQIIAAGIEHLLTEITLTETDSQCSLPGEDPAPWQRRQASSPV